MSRRQTVFMFSGQGSQYFQMGKGLYDTDPVFRHSMDYMDGVVRDLSGASVVDLLYKRGQEKSDPFDRILLSHPALFMVQYAMAQALIERGIRPDITLGASLGTFMAATVAGCISLDEALRIVVGHARILEESCERGAMIAVLASPRMYEDAALHRYCELAAINFHSHFVIAAPAGLVPAVEEVLRGERVTYQKLPVPFAFHSRWIEAAKPRFTVQLRSVRTQVTAIPVACCARARLLDRLPDDHFWHVTREPIRFPQTIQCLERAGAFQYVDVGPSRTLATFAKYALSETSSSTIHPILSPFGRDRENLETVAARLAS